MLKMSLRTGFLLIELLLALALLVSLISTIGYWQWQIMQQGWAEEQYLRALVVAENSLNRLMAGAVLRQSQRWQQGPYHLEIVVQPVTAAAAKTFQTLRVQVSWLEQFTQQRRSLALTSGIYA